MYHSFQQMNQFSATTSPTALTLFIKLITFVISCSHEKNSIYPYYYCFDNIRADLL